MARGTNESGILMSHLTFGFNITNNVGRLKENDT